MNIIPGEAFALLHPFASVFTQPTFQRFVVVLLGAILTTGRRTMANILRTVGGLAKGDTSSFNRVFSQARWSGLQAACILARFIIRHFYPQGVILLAGDDTVDEHRGKKVYGKSRHRDAVRSSHSYTAHRYGHKWVVLAILVRFPFTQRYWALPVLVALYRSPKDNQARGRKHKTPVELMRLMLAILMRWFPGRQFLFAGDGGFGTHELARFAHGSQSRVTLVSRFYANANLYDPPPVAKKSNKAGRPRLKGGKKPSPQDVVKKTRQRHRLTVAWYGGGVRKVEVVSAVAHWYKAGEGLVPVRWVFVHDRTGTHRDDYLFTTDLSLTPTAIIEAFTRRWNIETTFEEMRAYLGLETTRGWTRLTVLRAAPCLFGLYSVIALLFWKLPPKLKKDKAVMWQGKKETTFSDAITAVRRWLWTNWVFETSGHHQAFSKLPWRFKHTLLYALAPAA
jgi:hypothetical protein